MRRAILLGSLSLAILMLVERTCFAEQIIRVDERVPIGLLLITPTKQVARTSASEIIRVVSRVIESQTRLRVETKDEALFQECRGRISCLAKVSSAEELLLVVSDVTRENQNDRFSAVMIDVREALRIYGSASRESPSWEKEIESRIEQSCLLVGPTWIEIADVSRAAVPLESFVIKELRRV